MTPATDLIRAIESLGGRLRVDGECLVIAPKTVATPFINELRYRKLEIIALLAHRPAMPSGVRLIHWEPKEAPVNVSLAETVTDTRRFVDHTLGQIDARLHNRKWQAGNWTLSTLIDRLEAVGCCVEVEKQALTFQ
jgi:hypothetical protein